MGEIINFQERAQALTTAYEEDEHLNGAPLTSDPFPNFIIHRISHGRALMEAHVSTALAEAMVDAVKASVEPCSFYIYKRDESTAWIDGNLPTTVALTLLEMLAPGHLAAA
jgi:hypothetical protein